MKELLELFYDFAVDEAEVSVHMKTGAVVTGFPVTPGSESREDFLTREVVAIRDFESETKSKMYFIPVSEILMVSIEEWHE